MSNRSQNTNRTRKENILNILRLFLVLALTVIIFYPPYLQGLFFEKHVLPTQIFVFSIFIMFLIYKWLKNDYAFFKTPLEYISLGFVIVYFISIFVAVHLRSAMIEWLKYCMYFAVFCMISDLTDNLKTKLLFLWTIVISAVGVSIVGLDAAFGGNIVRLINNFFRVLGAQGDPLFGLFVENRIHSTLQYPNALASYLMAAFFVTVGLLMAYNKWWQRIILSSFAFILFLTFMLTQSRGAQLLFPVTIIILLVILPKHNRIKTVTHVLLISLPAGLASLLLYPYLSKDFLNKKALILFVIGLLANMLISYIAEFVGNFLQKISWKTYAIIITFFIIVSTIIVNYMIKSAIPAELFLDSSEENKTVSISKDIALKPNKEYILRFEADCKTEEETPFAFFVRIFNKNLSDILFFESEQLIRQNFSVTEGPEIFDITFSTKDDTKLVNVNFSIYYSGTSIKINNALIIDAENGVIVKKIVLKNKYNLDSIISRFQYILLQRSLVSRIVFYKDGLRIFKDNWFLGAGGGAWDYLYRKYQSYNYVSSQAHNYPLQLGIETGIFGIFLLIGLIIILISNYIKYIKIEYNCNSYEMHEYKANIKSRLLNAFIITSISTLLMHSLMDFDFSESSMLLLFWELIALFNREIIDSLGMKTIKSLNVKPKRNKHDISKDCKPVIFVEIVIFTITLYFSIAFFTATSLAKQSYEKLKKNDFETAIEMMEKAIRLDKYNEKYVIGYNPIQNRPDIKTGLMDILFMKNEILKIAQENGQKISDTDLTLFQKQFSTASLLIEKLEKKAKNNIILTSNLASFYFKIGEIDKGINYLNSAISYYPFEPTLWHSKIDIYYKLMREYFNNESYNKAKEYLAKGLSVIDEAKNVNKTNMNPFLFNKDSLKLLQVMKFLYDNWETDAIYEVNEIVHYSIFDLDVNMDGIPDQWRISNAELLNASIEGEKLAIQASERAYLYTHYPIKLEKGKTYQIEVKTDQNVENLSFYISGITSREIPLIKEDTKYKSEYKVENEPNEDGNQFRLFLESDCKIDSILIKELN